VRRKDPVGGLDQIRDVAAGLDVHKAQISCRVVKTLEGQAPG
jgi:hypothetical protein